MLLGLVDSPTIVPTGKLLDFESDIVTMDLITLTSIVLGSIDLGVDEDGDTVDLTFDLNPKLEYDMLFLVIFFHLSQ